MNHNFIINSNHFKKRPKNNFNKSYEGPGTVRRDFSKHMKNSPSKTMVIVDEEQQAIIFMAKEEKAQIELNNVSTEKYGACVGYKQKLIDLKEMRKRYGMVVCPPEYL